MVDKKDEVIEEEVIEQEDSSEEEQSYDDEFDALWGSKDNSDDELDKDEEEEDPADEDDDDGEDGATDGHKDTKPAREKPKPDTSDDPYKWIDNLPEEVQEQAKALRHAANSNQGRAAAFQRRSEELQRELDRTREETRRSSAASSAGKKASEPAAPELPEKFKQLKEDFPEFADAVEAIRQYDREQYEQKLQESLSPLNDLQLSREKEAFHSAVSTGAERIFNTKETGVKWQDIVNGEDFRAWLNMQPKTIQKAARIPDPDEALYVLERYESDYQQAIKEMGLDGKPEDKPGSTDAASKAKEVKQRRAARQKNAVSPGSKPVASDSEASGDYEAQFNAMWGQK